MGDPISQRHHRCSWNREKKNIHTHRHLQGASRPAKRTKKIVARNSRPDGHSDDVEELLLLLIQTSDTNFNQK